MANANTSLPFRAEPRSHQVVIPSGARSHQVVIPSGARSAEARNRNPPGRGTPLGGTERQTLMTQIALSRFARSQKGADVIPRSDSDE